MALHCLYRMLLSLTILTASASSHIVADANQLDIRNLLDTRNEDPSLDKRQFPQFPKDPPNDLDVFYNVRAIMDR